MANVKVHVFITKGYHGDSYLLEKVPKLGAGEISKHHQKRKLSVLNVFLSLLQLRLQHREEEKKLMSKDNLALFGSILVFLGIVFYFIKVCREKQHKKEASSEVHLIRLEDGKQLCQSKNLKPSMIKFEPNTSYRAICKDCWTIVINYNAAFQD